MAATSNTEDEELRTLLTQIIKTTHSTAELFEIASPRGDPPWEELPGAAIGTKSIRDWKQIWNSRRPQPRPPTGPGTRQPQSNATWQPTSYAPIKPAPPNLATTPALQGRSAADPPSETADKRKRGRPPKTDTDRTRRQGATFSDDQPHKRTRQDPGHGTTGTSIHGYPPPPAHHSEVTSPTTISSSGPDSAAFYPTSGSPSHFAPALGISAAPGYSTTPPSQQPPSYSPSQRVWSQSTALSDRESDRPRPSTDHIHNRPASTSHDNYQHPAHQPYRQIPQLPQPWQQQQQPSATFQAQVQAAPGPPLAPRPPTTTNPPPPHHEVPRDPSGGERVER